MEDTVHDTIMEEREELMVSPTGGNPTLRIAHFLKPSATSLDEPLSGPPVCSISNHATVAELSKWPLKVAFVGWRNPQNQWRKWVRHMHSLHQLTWKKAGIHEAVMNSTYEIPRNDSLVFGFAEKWCCETNTFVFPWGEATITLEDVMVLGGYSVLGDIVSSPLETIEMENIHKKLIQAHQEVLRSKARKADQSTWLAKFVGSGSEIEHEAFLALWLSRYVIPSSSATTVARIVFPIAVRLARGTKVGLGPAVLASIYRDLSLLKVSIVGSNNLGTIDSEDNVSEVTALAPLQLVQTWIWERFPTLRPNPNSTENDAPRMARWDKAKKVNSSLKKVRQALHSASEHFLWRPYAMAASRSSSCKLYQEKAEWMPVGSGFGENLISLARCFRNSELVGLKCTEQYLPHRVAMQFGLDQDIPGHVLRAKQSRQTAWENYTRPIGDTKLYVPSRLFEADVTTQYLDWWKQSISGENHETEAVRIKKSNSSNSERTMLQVSNEKKADNDLLVPPGFRPKLDVGKVNTDDDDDDEDRQTIPKLVRNMRAENFKSSSSRENGKPSLGAQVQSRSSSTAENGTIHKKKYLVKPVVNSIGRELAMEGSEEEAESGTVGRDEVSTANKRKNSSLNTCETLGLDLEARISKLEYAVALLKAAKFGHGFG
ncbi:hypothetical protein RJ639_039426 [Escallonia herrerae]|uniref:Aminotransferase-like plant mobile domain-containing protein n=1 Tax=Escallonia herrerae TaxID=1293975 RepID=A0AA89B3D4_9ASTE|nr:hypothetical protein RJ639_039426 [Escallonia herrerae]